MNNLRILTQQFTSDYIRQNYQTYHALNLSDNCQHVLKYFEPLGTNNVHKVVDCEEVDY